MSKRLRRRLAPLTGLTLAAFAAAIACGLPALAGDRCVATGAASAALDIFDDKHTVLGTVEKGSVLVVQRYGEDNAGKPLAYVATESGRRLGWIYRQFIRCA